MYLISNEYFKGKYEISNINESNSGSGEALTLFIDTEVPLFMLNLLGSEFREFERYIKDGALVENAPQKWLDLVNGVEYDGKKWNGLLYAIGTYKKSLLTNYIWTKFFVERNRIDGNLNSNVIDSKNAVRGNPANQYYPIWNEFVSLVIGSSCNGFVTLNQYITDKKDTYPTANFINIEYENRFL